ncbi:MULTISPECIES: hypothetical protein [Natrialbaceae]|uniref:hypothetical protein n=1 Tax=Natrialbaceae TaxID=1644061 RepID=UPI00207D5433|nr:hypothetical protein [Natronococcus sp. CG52]
MSFGIETSTMILASATLFGAVVGSILPRYLNRRSERKHLRRGLKKEIKLNTGHNWGIDFIRETQPENLGPTAVFEANADKIGQLTEGEVNAIVEFYGYLHNSETLLTDAVGSSAPPTKETLEVTLEDLGEARQEAIDAIEKEL